MIFEQIATGGCRSYLIGCADTCGAALIDPELTPDRPLHGAGGADGLRIRYVDRHPHPCRPFLGDAASSRAALGVPVVMHRREPGALRRHAARRRRACCWSGGLRLQALHTPGHTRDSMCLVVEDRVFTGDTLLIGGTGRTDLPSGDRGSALRQPVRQAAELDPALKVFPAHEYKGRSPLDHRPGDGGAIRACRNATAAPSSR